MIKCQCCGLEVPTENLKRGEQHPTETDSAIVILRGHERHWVGWMEVQKAR